MYLVELRPGKEELYRSVDELAAAIRRGDVDAHSRIFHRATSKWISITLHPQFKAIAAADTADVPPQPQKQWTFLTSAADELDQDHHRTVEPATDAEPESTASSSAEPATDSSSSAWQRPFALGIAGLLLLLGAQAASSAPRQESSPLGFGPASRTRSNTFAVPSGQLDWPSKDIRRWYAWASH